MIFFFVLLFLFGSVVLLTDVLNKFDDGFEVEIVDAVLDLFVMRKGVIVSQEALKQLRNAVFHGFLFQDTVQDELCDEFDVAEDFFLGFFEEVILVLI